MSEFKTEKCEDSKKEDKQESKSFKALGTLRQQQLKDLFHLFLIAGLLAECFQQIVGPLALVMLQIVIGIQQVDELAQMEACLLYTSRCV